MNLTAYQNIDKRHVHKLYTPIILSSLIFFISVKNTDKAELVFLVC